MNFPIMVRQRIGPTLARFCGDQSGNIAILFAVMLVVLMLSIGAAIDIGRWLHARDQTAQAIDAAVLAGGRVLQTNNKNEAAAIAAAQKYYQENVTSRLPVVDDSVNFRVADNGKAVSAQGHAYIKTPFLHLASIDRLPLFGNSETELARAELAIGGSGGENLEISMMLDVTGSMSGRKLQDLKDAAKDLVDIVVWEDQSEFTSKVALVPFSEDIRLPDSGALNKARGTALPKKKTITRGRGRRRSSTDYYLSDCVVERIGPQRYTDAAPGPGQYVLGHYTQNTQGQGNGRKGVCSIPDKAAVVPLSDDKKKLKRDIDALSASGGTAGQLGTAWSWYTLSPNWASLWAAPHRPKAYGTDKLRKIAILMTDGEYNTQYDSEGISASARDAANGSSTDQARALCAAMKQKGITIYTVGFELSGSYSQSYQTLSKCATDSTKFYDAKDGEQLKQAFRDIAIKLSSLYLSK